VTVAAKKGGPASRSTAAASPAGIVEEAVGVGRLVECRRAGGEHVLGLVLRATGRSGWQVEDMG
jgi:hypothetical protein